jgi:tetratricopeptide (TPR) repeat protein
MQNKNWFYFSFVFVRFISPHYAQKTEIYTHDLKEYNRAVELYKEKQYLSAQIIFKKLVRARSEEVQSDCAYYIANCAIRLNQPNADLLMEKFVANYPTSSKHNQAYIEVAHYYFDEGKYPQALQWFEKVDESNLTAGEKERFNFQKGYANFSGGKKKEATSYFQ